MQKASFVLSICALLLSVCALVVSASAYKRAEERMEQAWMRREQRLVQIHAPKFNRLYADLGVKSSKEPETLDDLLNPLVRMIDGLPK